MNSIVFVLLKSKLDLLKKVQWDMNIIGRKATIMLMFIMVFIMAITMVIIMMTMIEADLLMEVWLANIRPDTLWEEET